MIDYRTASLSLSSDSSRESGPYLGLIRPGGISLTQCRRNRVGETKADGSWFSVAWRLEKSGKSGTFNISCAFSFLGCVHGLSGSVAHSAGYRFDRIPKVFLNRLSTFFSFSSYLSLSFSWKNITITETVTEKSCRWWDQGARDVFERRKAREQASLKCPGSKIDI